MGHVAAPRVQCSNGCPASARKRLLLSAHRGRQLLLLLSACRGILGEHPYSTVRARSSNPAHSSRVLAAKSRAFICAARLGCKLRACSNPSPSYLREGRGLTKLKSSMKGYAKQLAI